MNSSGKVLFTSQGADGHSDAENVDNSRHLMLAISSANLANLRVRVKGSISQDQPDFTGAQSPTNQWGYVMLKDLNDGATINGDAGVVYAGTDALNFVEVNTNGIKHLCVEVDNYVAGDVSVYSRSFTER